MVNHEFPERGFYRHYKHDPAKSWNNYHYEVVGIGWHTESEEHLVLYRPLYGDRSYLEGADVAARPLPMFVGDVEKDGKTFPRFIRVTEPALIEKLTTLRKELYGA